MWRYEHRARENRRLIRSFVGMLTLIAGVSLVFSPFLTTAYNQYFLADPVQEEIAMLLENWGGDAEIPFIIPEPEEPDLQVDYPDALPPEEGVLKIPVLGLHVNVGYGVELSDLRKSPGFYPQSGYPDTGNVAIAGHRATYGAPFRFLDRLETGDEIILYYGEKVYVYSVESTFVTHARDWSVIDPTPEPALTLTTCHPLVGRATQRLVVRAYLETAFKPEILRRPDRRASLRSR